MTNAWLDDLLTLLTCERLSEAAIEEAAVGAVQVFGFQHYFVVYRPPLPVASWKVYRFTNYPRAWLQHYREQEYWRIDPRVQLVKQSREPVIWDETLFGKLGALSLWKDMEAWGLSCGWTQSVGNRLNGITILSVCRGGSCINRAAFSEIQPDLKRLAALLHQLVSRLAREITAEGLSPLSEREIEVLRLTADGKTAQDIAEILGLSLRTVNFHVRNAESKLKAPNKTAAVMRAVSLGLLSSPSR